MSWAVFQHCYFIISIIIEIEALAWIKLGGQDIGKYRTLVCSGHLFVHVVLNNDMRIQ